MQSKNGKNQSAKLGERSAFDNSDVALIEAEQQLRSSETVNLVLLLLLQNSNENTNFREAHIPRTQTHNGRSNIMLKLEAELKDQVDQAVEAAQLKNPNTNIVKDLKRVKELERKRRSLLIYGTEDMRTVIQ